MRMREISREKMNRLLWIATVFIVVWTSIELLFTRIWNDWLPIVPSLLGYLSEGVLLLMVLAVIIHPDFGRKRLMKWINHPIHNSLFVFFVFAIFSMFINNVPFAQGVFGVRALFQFFILYFVLLTMDLPENWIKQLFHIILGLGIVQSVIGIIQIILEIPLPLRNIQERRSISVGEEIRAFGLMDSSNTLGGYLVAVLLLLVTYVFVYRQHLTKKQFLLYSVIGILFLVAIGLTFSRQAFLALIACLGLIGLIFRKNKAFRIMLVAAVSLFILFVVGYGLSLLLFEGFAQRNLYTLDLSKNYRYLIVLSGLLVFTFSPIFGVGPGMFGSNAAFVFDSPFHQFMHEDLPTTMTTVDNNALYVLVEYGVIGILLLGWFVWGILKLSMRLAEQANDKLKWLGLFILAFSTALFFMGLLSTAWENHQIVLFFWLFFAVMMNWYQKEQSEE